MFEKLGKVSTEVEKLRKAVQAKAQEELKPGLQEAIEQLSKEIPTLESVRWQQYTPHFNDGEACEFGLHGVYAKFQGDSEGDYGDGYHDISWTSEVENCTPKQGEMLNSFANMLEEIEEVLQDAFGDHAQVTLNMNGEAEVEEYDHD